MSYSVLLLSVVAIILLNTFCFFFAVTFASVFPLPFACSLSLSHLRTFSILPAGTGSGTSILHFTPIFIAVTCRRSRRIRHDTRHQIKNYDNKCDFFFVWHTKRFRMTAPICLGCGGYYGMLVCWFVKRNLCPSSFNSVTVAVLTITIICITNYHDKAPTNTTPTTKTHFSSLSNRANILRNDAYNNNIDVSNANIDDAADD